MVAIKNKDGTSASPLVILYIITNLRQFLRCSRVGQFNDVIMAKACMFITN